MGWRGHNIDEFARALQPHFPQLLQSNFAVTSPPDRGYNCIAWAAGDTQRWWWPDAEEDDYWPKGARRQPTLEAFVQAFAVLGFSPCDSADPEPGFEKVAVYALDGEPTHAARQLVSGWWTSKLGKNADIHHEKLEDVDGDLYGAVAQILRRVRVDSSGS